MPEKTIDEIVDSLITELKECEGPCGKLCLHCPAAYMLDYIIQVVERVRKERNEALAAAEK